jgi:aldose 1-epimerase
MIECEKWGELGGKDIFLYTLENSKGMKVRVTNLGCAVTGIEYKGLDVALGFDHPDAYLSQSSYLGVIVGRCANRIKGGRFTIDGKEYQVGRNLGDNHLHGGFKGFDKVLWDVESVDETACQVRFSYLSKDGEEGYPGNLTAKVAYSLDEGGCLKIDYEAGADRTSVINLTNHTYFNLSGHNAGSIENHNVRICSDHYLETDVENVPTGKIVPVVGTPFDFREFHRIGERIDGDDIQLKYGGGYDHNWNLDQDDAEGLRLAAEAFDEKTGIGLQVYTTMPGIQFYSGNSLNEKNDGKGGAVYGRRCGFCLETQYYPDAVNQKTFLKPVFLPGQIYRHTTIYRLYFDSIVDGWNVKW